MLELRSRCEHCGMSLPPDSRDARICSFECTFCRECVTNVLANVCPNCGGGFVPRPVRPREMLAKYPPTKAELVKPVDLAAHRTRRARYEGVDPHDR